MTGTPTTRRHRLAPALGVLLAVTVIGGACGGDGGGDVADDREAQIREVATQAGLAEDVIDVLALAARGASATFQITYAGDRGSELVVSQDPPNRRVDVLTAGLIVESRVVRDGVGYLCSLEPGGRPGDPLDCSRHEGGLSGPGTFTADALRRFADDLAESSDEVELTVSHRTLAGVEATCLTSAPKPGTVLDGTAPGVDTICLAPDGAQLLIDTDGERVAADTYRAEVPDGTFDV